MCTAYLRWTVLFADARGDKKCGGDVACCQITLDILVGPIPWGHSGPLCYALSSSSSSSSWTSMRRRRATVTAVATPGEWQCKTARNSEWAQHFSNASCWYCSDLRTRLDRQGQDGYKRPLRDGQSWKGDETHQDRTSRPQSSLEREVLVVSILPRCINNL